MASLRFIFPLVDSLGSLVKDAVHKQSLDDWIPVDVGLGHNDTYEQGLDKGAGAVGGFVHGEHLLQVLHGGGLVLGGPGPGGDHKYGEQLLDKEQE